MRLYMYMCIYNCRFRYSLMYISMYILSNELYKTPFILNLPLCI